MTYKLDDRFWSKVNKTNGCWEWTKGTDKGYGKYKIDGQMRLAHRVSYQAHFGVSLTPDQVLLHECDNPLCVKPTHLKVGTVLENNEDKLKKGRQTKGSAIFGAKFDENKVKHIRELYQNGYKIMDMAREHNVQHSTISNIVHHKTWTHV